MVKNIRLVINDKMDLKVLFYNIKDSFEKNDEVSFIFDGTKSNVSMETVKSFKKIFDKFEKEIEDKLVEILIIVSGSLKKMALSGFLKIFTIFSCIDNFFYSSCSCFCLMLWACLCYFIFYFFR